MIEFINWSDAKLSSLNRKLLFLLFILLSISIPFSYANQGVSDPFLFWHIAFVEEFLNEDHFPFEDKVYSPEYIPGAITMLLLIAKVSSIPPKILQFLPIMGLILPIILLALCKRVSSSMLLGCISVLIIMNIPEPTSFFFFWPHAFGFALYIPFILIYSIMVERKNVEYIILILILFISVHFYSYTVESWLIIFAISLNILIKLPDILMGLNAKSSNKDLTAKLSIAFLIIFFGFNSIIYESYIPRGRYVSTLVESYQNFLFYNSLFFSNNIPHSKFTYYRLEATPLLPITSFLYFIIMLLIFLWSFVFILNKLTKHEKGVNISKRLLKSVAVKYALLIVGLGDIIIYGARGVIPWRYIYFIFPIIILFSLNEIMLKRNIKMIILISLLILSVTHTGLIFKYNIFITDPDKYSNLEPSALWFVQYSPEKEILSDLRTGNKYLLESVCKDSYVEKHIISSRDYELLVDNKYSMEKNNYLYDISPFVIINTKLKLLQSLDWHNYEPFTIHLNDLNRNLNLHKIYDDNTVWILKTEGLVS